MSSAVSVLELALDRPATLGPGRLVCIDGPAGSGKTTLAADLAALVPDVRVIHMDDLYAGWSGLPQIDHQLTDLLVPLAGGRAGSYRRYDWVAGDFAEQVVVEPVPLLVIEGVGSGARQFEPQVTVLVWVDAPHDLRMARGLARDGDTFAPRWEQWAADETTLFTKERTRERADVVIDGTRPFG